MSLLTRRRAVALIVLATVAGGVAYSRAPEPEVGRAAMAQLTDGAWLADSLSAAERVADPATPRSRELDERRNHRAIALGYLERHRLGLGSPFRLADQARQDPRLQPALRNRLAWALLSRTLHRGGYVVDPAALAPLEPGTSSTAPRDTGSAASDAVPARHLALIERSMSGAGDPRAGELALRIAYTLAESERLLPARSAQAVAPVLALVRDRLAAATDARRLLWAAESEKRDAIVMLGEWRQARALAVERPASEATDHLLAPEVATLAAVLLDSIRTLERIPSGEPELSVVESYTRDRPILSRQAAARLSALSRTLPPQAPVVVSARAQRAAIPSRLRDGFLEGARNEEGLAAEHALLRLRGEADAIASRIVTNAAVALRPYAQSPVWFPGSGGPTAATVATSLGLRSIVFDADIPRTWQPFFLAGLERSVADLRSVLPSVSLQGARVHFVTESPRRGALALHDPGTRTIVLPISTAGGTLAHEIAHEMDWQAARRLYARRGTYSTDRAIAEERGRLAVSVRGLTAASLVAPDARNGYRAPHDKRPAEVFARNLDWFVAVSLAREGRMGGDLTAVQDEVLTGYASVLPGEVGGRGALALMDVLSDVAYVREPVRSWFLDRWGQARDEAGLPLVRRVLGVPLQRASRVPDSQPAAEISNPALPLQRALEACASRPATKRDAAAERLVTLAAESRARGILRSRVQRLRAYGMTERADALEGSAPWTGDEGRELVDRLRGVMLREMRAARASRNVFGGTDGACASL